MAAGPDGLPFARGHGTQNDFVVVPDPDGTLDLAPAAVAALCHRRAGIGGDGLLRVVRSRDLPEGLAQAGDAEWFMDYRNADGSLAEMCGNGVRVFAAYLLRHGLARLGRGETLAVGTRAGVKTVRRDGEWFAVDLGPWFLPGGADAVESGGDVEVDVAGEPVTLPGLRVDVGNPHVVVTLPGVGVLRRVDLAREPVVHPEPVDGANVEIVVPAPERDGVGHLAMRVHERGVGETRSCGTGAVAAVLATRVWGGPGAPGEWTVDVPGGRLRVGVPAADRFRGDRVELAGPAVIVAEGTVDAGWLAAVTDDAGRAGAGQRPTRSTR